MKKKYTIILTMLILMLILSVFGCKSDDNSPATGDKTDQADPNDLPEAEQSGTMEYIPPELPEMDFGGEEIKFLVKQEGGPERWTSIEIFAEEMNGEIINDEIYKRNRRIEEKYNTFIAQEYMMAGGANTFDMFRRINTLVLAADDTYDIVIPTLEDSARIAQEGLYLDLNALPYVDLSKPWWNQKILETTVQNNKAFFATGNISILSMQATYITLFNKEVHQLLGLEDMYQIVR